MCFLLRACQSVINSKLAVEELGIFFLMDGKSIFPFNSDVTGHADISGDVDVKANSFKWRREP